MPKHTITASIKKYQKFVQKNSSLFIIGAILVTLLIGTMVAVQLSQQQQELRQQAMIADGPVQVSITPNPAQFALGQASQLTFAVNTADIQVIGMQFIMDFKGSFASPPTVTPITASGLSMMMQLVEPNATGDGYKITFAMNKIGSGGLESFSTSTPLSFATIDFTPTSISDLTLTFDQTGSKSIKAQTTPGEDVLRTIAPMTFTVAEPLASVTPGPTSGAATSTPLPTATIISEATGTPIPTNTPIIACDPIICPSGETPVTVDPNNQPCPLEICVANTPVPTQIAQATNTPNPTSTPLPTATPEQGTGGTILRTCGQSCSAHADCAINLMCYSGVCRLANNPTDIACNNPPDNGLARSCNEYCADSRECQSGLTCYYNKCRNPRNVSDAYCSEPVAYVTRAASGGTTRYVTATPSKTPLPTQGAAATLNPVNYITPSPFPTFTTKPRATFAPIASVSPTGTPTQEVTMLERIQSWLKSLLIIALAISAVFLILWLLPIFLKRRKDDDDNQPPMTTPPSAPSNSQYSDELHRKTSRDV